MDIWYRNRKEIKSAALNKQTRLRSTQLVIKAFSFITPKHT